MHDADGELNAPQGLSYQKPYSRESPALGDRFPLLIDRIFRAVSCKASPGNRTNRQTGLIEAGTWLRLQRETLV
jgi:hypothetical protein